MGKSKFPGKPSKIVNKKRVSVLNSVANNPFGDNSAEDDGDQVSSSESETTKTFDGHGTQETIPHKTNPPDPPDKINDTMDITADPSGGILTRGRNKTSDTSEPPVSKPVDKPVKQRKTVTFKNVLETSDDVNIVKKVYNPDKVPVVPIIKINKNRDKGDILTPSRLTDVAKNYSGLTKLAQNHSADHIDKVNLLTFKSSLNVNSLKERTDVPSVDKKIVNFGFKTNSSSCSSSIEVPATVTSEKKFVLPKRSAHSCRVIKPNKKFFEDGTEASNKNSKKSGCKKSSRKDNTSREDDDKVQKTDNFINNTLSSQINSSKLDEQADEESEASQTASDANSDDGSDVESEKVAEPNPFNPFAARPLTTSTSLISASKLILREPRLQFSSSLTSTTSATTPDGPFSLNLNSINPGGSSLNTPLTLASPSTLCGVCGTFSTLSKPLHQSRKFGINSCGACRKFISKTIKKLAASSGSTSTNVLQCHKNDGTCIISPTNKGNHPKRCHACWLKKCIKAFQVPSGLRSKLMATLPANMRESDSMNHKTIISPFSLHKSSEMSSINMFSTLSASSNRMLSWPQESSGESEFKTKLSLSNPLVENNSTFGSTPLMKPTIAEKPVIMVSSTSSSTTTTTTTTSDSTKQKIQKPQSGVGEAATSSSKSSNKEAEETSRLRVRKKEKVEVPVPTPVQPTANPTNEPAKRQRIDLKGPRVKHVCRSASIVLGQPIATFPIDEETALESMDTPPRLENELEPEKEKEFVQTAIAKQKEQMRQDTQSPCTDCTGSSSLSPPATPIQSQEDESLQNSNSSKSLLNDETSSLPSSLPTTLIESTDDTTTPTVPDTTTLKKEESLKPMTRKLTRPALLSNIILGTTNKKLNSFSRQTIKAVPAAPPTISIDFWENYDPAEVSQTGFGLIVSENIPLRALCFLCGSAGLDALIFCVCCCEPYHQYCVEDEYNLKHSLDDTNLSILDSTLTGANQTQSLNNRLNWLCPRCTVCYTCNMASGSKVKCQKCQKNYHSTCLGTSKRLLGADRPLICANCLKCKSCGTTNVSKFVGNLPMCSSCFQRRQKGHFCPLCQKCYEDNDFNIKMMECGDCKKWVHAKCEELTDEQYNMLSVLPENIEFICKKCAKTNSTADKWREAVAAEFKSGLLSVIRLLSKSRQACALLKLSPRKKPGSCICQPIQSNRNIQFDKERIDDELHDCETMDTESDMQFDDSTAAVKCYCGAGQKVQPMSTAPPSLLEIKQKIGANEYYSLADFNYDMNLITTAAACDELTITYKEILSEAFPWFQNETKACTDALEEDMYDSCNFQENSANIECDQQVPMIDVPDDIDDYFYTPNELQETRICMFCKSVGEGGSLDESRLLYCGQNCWVHTNCAMWSAEVFEEIDGSLQNVHSAISRGRSIKCSKCGSKGATVGCNVKNCGEQFHYKCARSLDCAFMVDKTVYCPQHLADANRKKCTIEKNFEVHRPVYVELDRKRRKSVDPSRVQFVIGALQVKQLGKFVTSLSDTNDAIVPADFHCTRLYWSSKEPWKIVEYTVRTSIQNNNFSLTLDTGRNFTVDHSNSLNMVQRGLTQISKWHSSLANGEDYEYIIRQERSVKQLLEAVNGIGSADETNEDEPQNNADLLPPEIKDAIFEDLPHDILDGISMLDIFPKLMTYEDLVAMDSKNEVYLSNDLSRDVRDYNMSDDELSDGQKDYDGGSDSWMNNTNPNVAHVEDAMLSARSISRELKRSKSEVFSRGVAASRSQQRSSSLNWSSKLETNAAKRRKMNLRLADGVLMSLGRRKDDLLPLNVSERRRSDDIRHKNFTWSAAKRFNQSDDNSLSDSLAASDILDKLKISQLDGMDDVSSCSEDNSPVHEFSTYDNRESPVKCDRCHCTYRTVDSYNRHLPQCEPLSTSESESEPRSPDMQSPPHNMIITSMSGQDFMPIMTTQHQNSSQQIYNFNGQQINPISIQNIQGHPIQIHSSQLQHNTSMSMQNQCAISNSGVQMQQLNQPIQNMIINATNGQQQQLFAQPLQNIGQQIFPIQNLQQSQFGGIEIQNKSQQQRMNSTPQTITLPNGINIQTSQPIMHQQQPQIITFSQANGQPQIVITPTSSTQQNVSNYTTTTRTIQQSPYKNQLILPQPDKSPNKRNMMPKIMPQSNGMPRAKGRTVSAVNKPIQIKRTIVKNEPKPVIFNQSLPLIRPMNDAGNVVIQQNPSAQPIIVQQIGGNQNNLVQYVTDNQNAMQYIAMPTNGGDFKQPQTQYLTPNPLVPGTFQLQTADNGNLLLANSSGGLQMLPNGTLQLAQPQQPQVIGTIIQQQPNGQQFGMMSAEQMMLGQAPTLEMMTNPANGCMLLTSQPVYYGLETIVQNTVMSSQQFVSTAMQGVLSQNASFSATTTQVFQASKIEPIMEMPTGYVVLNNDGTIMQSQPSQQPSILSNVMQQGVPQMSQLQSHQIQPIQQLQSQQQQQPANSAWRFVDDKSTIQLLPQHQQQNQTQQHSVPITLQSQPQPSVRPNQSPKPIVKSAPIVVTKVQPQNKILANPIQQYVTVDAKSNQNQNILPKPENVITSYDQFIMQPNTSKFSAAMPNYQQQKSITITTPSPQMPIHPIPRKSNAVKQPAAKIAAATVRPKVITRPVMSSKVQPTQPQTSKMMTITPATSTSSPIVIPPNPIIVPLYEPVAETPPITIQSPTITLENTTNPTNCDMSPSNTENLSTAFSQQQQQSFVKNTTNVEQTSQLSTNQTSSQKPIPATPTTYSPTQQQYPSTSQSQSITLPIAASIQLPTAPYAPTYSNGIPTNVVNPIPQYNYTNTRPTNRVLPMQTVHQKNNPLTPPEPKSVDVTTKKIITVDTSKLSPIIEQELSPNQLVIVEKDDEHFSVGDDGRCSVSGFDQDDDLNMEIDKIIESKASHLSPNRRDTPSDSDDLFNKLKGEHDSLLSREDSNSERTSPDVKDKICEILVNLENDDCTKNAPESDSDMFSMNEVDQQTVSCKSEPEQHKENLIPAALHDHTTMMKYQKSMLREQQPLPKSTGPKMLYEIQSQDGFTYKSTSISEIWEKVFETVQVARKAHGLSPLPEGPLADMCGHQMLGLKTNALKYLLEQLPGVEKCTKYQPKYHKKPQSTISGAASSGYCSDTEELKENVYGAARCEGYSKRSDYDMFSWLASRHRKQPIQLIVPQNLDSELMPRRGTGSNLPMAMRYRTLKETYKETVGVYRSHIHGRGLFCNRDIEAGEMVIEYAGELIRSTLTDKRERYYDSRGIGCYMFKIDDNLVVDATMRGNAARFINHACEPNCYSKVVDILGHKHIIIFALRRIVQGEELTYDYKFPFEETKIPCSCGSKKCRRTI
ncbi:histone-lysine N-methyltransferase trithorax isoform X2 [Bradysia coprophila]|uniref:histone-lysine N-methyltransferase trithorax isoform X2 n=1 Tax=Bradysia coprophila TaxID=38358 RepID=UPI00187D9AA2|nr:histone-lysine N-methyltransferase trithorax isoform X2 [Bradysia coprophila]